MINEKEISLSCKNGNNKARKELYEHYKGMMFALIMRYVSDKYIASDILHDGFISSFLNIGKFEWRGDGSLRAWMSRLFINQTIGFLRTKDILKDSSDIDTICEDVFDVTSEEVNDISSDQIYRFIKELPTGYRTIFNLFAVDGLSHKEIAQMLNISEKTSSSQFFRAKKIMASKIIAFRKSL